MNTKRRLQRLNEALQRGRAEALLVTHMPNVRYLTGFTGSAGVLLAGTRPVFWTDGRYGEQARREVKGARVVVAKGPAITAAPQHAASCGVQRLGFEAEHVTVAQRKSLSPHLGGVRMVETSGIVEGLRCVKDSDEIARIRAAIDLASRCFKPLLRVMRPGVAESDVAAHLEFTARKGGASAMSFETIVAGGARSALPHGVASRAPLPARGFVVLDYGVILDGYCSDMTRTVHMGRASREFKALYEAVLEAQLAAISAVRPGVSAGDVDAAARNTLQQSKLAKYFTHSTGHGVGLEIHEIPRIGAKQQTALEPGMVITIEPGIYIPGRCGIRIEDMVLVTATGCEVLTPVSKELIEI
ncbi:MAG TPA: Xaa-Pro peptidase family protein [candidate division Zixibacteria bacterium]|nr:Xaa-Pro peptidase family protein [candidate division Zixibacteria bacterium]